MQGSSGYNTNPDDAPAVNAVVGESSREVIAKLRKEFMSRPPEEPVLQRPKANKYLSPERRFSPTKVNGELPPPPVASSVVEPFSAPQIHHAERVTLRSDSSSSSDVEEETESSTSKLPPPQSGVPPAHMVLQSPMDPLPQSIRRPHPQQEQQLAPPPPLMPRPQQQQRQSQHDPESQTSITSSSDPDPTYSVPGPRGGREGFGAEQVDEAARDFGDPALAHFESMPQYQGPPQQRKQKKSGFGLFGLFKKKEKGQPKAGKERPKSSYLGQDWRRSDNSSRSPSTSPTRSPAMMPRSQSQPFIDKPIPPPHAGWQETAVDDDYPGAELGPPVVVRPGSAFGASVPDMTSSPLTQRKGDGGREPMPPPPQDPHFPPAAPGFKPLERKRSMSKPTDLDELIRLQEEEERRLREENLRAPLDTAHDVTQEIDVDEALGYDTDEAVKNIEWPNSDQEQQQVCWFYQG